MPKWIHERAMSMKKDMEKTYGKEKAEQVAFAVATQQSHRLGKSPKTFVSKVTGKKERFGTPEGRKVAKMKFDKPRKEYMKTAEAEMEYLNLLSDDARRFELMKEAGLFSAAKGGGKRLLERVKGAPKKPYVKKHLRTPEPTAAEKEKFQLIMAGLWIKK